MPRLLILCEYPTLLGGERSMLATLPAVAAAGFDIAVAAPPAEPLAGALQQRGLEHVPWKTVDARGERLLLDELRTELESVIRIARPDLLHANSLSTSRISGPVASAGGTPSVGHLRDIIKVSQQAITDINTHRRLLAVSRATRDFHVGQGIDAKRCLALHNGVDLNEFQPRSPSGYLHRELNLPPSVRLIAVVGQLGLRKGTDVALSTALQLADRAPDAHWLIVGERTSNKDESREFEALLRSIAEERPLAGRAHFLGSRNDMPQLLNECTLVVHAARQEPLSRVLLEAAASGVAAVATEVGGTREIFPTEAEGGVIVPADNRSALADAVLSLLGDDNRRQSVARAARRRAESAFDIRIAAARLIEQYQLTLK